MIKTEKIKTVDHSTFDNRWFDKGAPSWKIGLWFITNALFFINPLNPFSGLKTRLLRLFGAKIGKGVVIKPGVNVKYPWRLEIGDYAWIGERVWIDNLTWVRIGQHVCLSQGAMLLTGNHNYKSTSFDLVVGEILLENGVWIGAKATVCPGVKCGSHAILSVGSVATEDLIPYTIYQGNPAKSVRKRNIL